IVYLTGANTVWRLGYSEAFLSPAPFFRFKEYPGFVPNPDLLPEKMRALDLGWQREWTNNLDLNVVAYRLLLEDVIYRTIGGTTVNPDSNQNLGTLDNTGVNLALNWAPSAGYEYWLSAGYIDGRLENIDPMQPSSEYPVLFTSRWHGSLGMTWSGKRYTVTPSLEFADRADGGFAAVNEGGSSPGYGLVNLFVRMHNVLVKNGEVTLKIQNVFDRRWYQPGLGRMDFSAVPQETRNIMLGYSWRY
ncbi:MAG: vitamin transporter, partial [Pseudomonadota bacterium]|nr:vitamin transporter [Pseudomonadota bacterium]